MRRHFTIAALSLMLVTINTTLAQQLYRWVDQNGRVTYSQNPPPAGAAKNVQQKKLSGSVVEGSDLPYAAQIAVNNFPVTLYTSPDCNDACKQGRDSLSKRGIPFKEISVGDDQSVEALRKLSGGTRIPTLQVGSQVSTGFEPGAWKAALDNAGYPASIPASTRRQASGTVQRNLPAVKLYTNPLCGLPCQGAKDLLTARGVNYQEVEVGSDASLEELKKVSGSNDVVPILLVGGTPVRGFDSVRYQSVLDNAGFPKTAGTAAK